MRKSKIFDNLLWYSLYMLPIILIVLAWSKGQFLPLTQVLESAGLSLLTNNVVYDALVSMFGSASEYLPTFLSDGVIEYLAYFIMLMIIHIVVDVLLFIPRYCHKLIDKGVAV